MGEFKVLGRASGSGAFKELNRASGSGAWKTLEWESAGVDIGAACEDYDDYSGGDYTLINKSNPANASGTITNVCLYMHNSQDAGVTYIGIFYVVSGNDLKCRSAHCCGALNVGINNETVSLAVQPGDYIAFYGMIDQNMSGGEGFWYVNAQSIIVNDERTYGFVDSKKIACYGTG